MRGRGGGEKGEGRAEEMVDRKGEKEEWEKW